MPKTVRTMTIDADISKRFQQAFPGEASSFCELAMRKRLEVSDNSLEGVSKELLTIEENKLQKSIDDLENKLMVIRNKKSILDKNFQDEEIKRLQAEQDRINKLSTCAGCNKQMDENFKKISVGDKFFCKDCFMSENPKFIKAQREHRG